MSGAGVPEPNRIASFSTGAVRTKRGERGIRRYLPGGWRASTLPVNVFVLWHPEGVCVFDAGQSALAAEPGYFPRWYPFFRLARFELGPEDEAGGQLERLGVGRDEVSWLVLSHLHTDHVGGVGGLTADEVVVSRTEWQRAQGWGGRLRGYVPQYWPAGVTPRLVDFEDGPVGPFGGSSSLTADGALVLVPTPGHTPGHMSLLATVDDRRYLLAGDLSESARDLDESDPVAAYCRGEGIAVLTTHDPRVDTLLRGVN